MPLGGVLMSALGTLLYPLLGAALGDALGAVVDILGGAPPGTICTGTILDSTSSPSSVTELKNELYRLDCLLCL